MQSVSSLNSMCLLSALQQKIGLCSELVHTLHLSFIRKAPRLEKGNLHFLTIPLLTTESVVTISLILRHYSYVLHVVFFMVHPSDTLEFVTHLLRNTVLL